MNHLTRAERIHRYGWLANFVFIAAGAYLLAFNTSAVLSSCMRLVPGKDYTPRIPELPPRHQRDPFPSYGAIAARNLLGARREPPWSPGSDERSGKIVGPDPTELHACSLAGSVRGTLVADGPPEWSLAVIYLNRRRMPVIVSVREDLQTIDDDTLLIQVRRRAVVIERHGRLELCEAEPSNRERRHDTPAPPSRPPSIATLRFAEPIHELGEGRFEVDAQYLEEEVWPKLAQIVTQVKMIPSFRGGQLQGFKALRIRKGSIIDKIGLRNGDVVHGVNGHPFDSTETALRLFLKLRSATTISLEISRRGRRRDLSYEIR